MRSSDFSLSLLRMIIFGICIRPGAQGLPNANLAAKF
jgi:hypothetical protein